MCRWALISWPITAKTPQSFYLILGELYNNDVKTDKVLMSEFFRDLQYLYPFRFSTKKNYCYNIEDFIYLQKKYYLTVNLKLVGNPEKDIIIFKPPVLYDIDCNVSIFSENLYNYTYKPKNSHVCIVFPYSDAITRGKLLEEAIEYGPSYFVLIGNSYKNNKESTACLMRRFLLSRNIPEKCIVKIRQDNNTESILDAVVLFHTYLNTPFHIAIACGKEHIQNIAKCIKIWKKKNLLSKERKVYYICP